MAFWRTQLLMASVLALSASPTLSAPWVRGYVVDNYEPAFYYGGRGGTEEQGSDCPKGTIPILDYKTVLKTSWRTDAEIAKLTLPVSKSGVGVPPEPKLPKFVAAVVWNESAGQRVTLAVLSSLDITWNTLAW